MLSPLHVLDLVVTTPVVPWAVHNVERACSMLAASSVIFRLLASVRVMASARQRCRSSRKAALDRMSFPDNTKFADVADAGAVCGRVVLRDRGSW